MMSNQVDKKDILQEIPDSDLPELRDLYKNHWPYALHAYYFVDNYIEWKAREITNIKFYCPNGRWNDGTFLAVDEGPSINIFLFTLEKSGERLRNALSQTKQIKWDSKKKTKFFLAVHGDHLPIVVDELNRRRIPIVHEDVANMWWISKDKALKYEYEIPNEVYLAPLKTEDADTMNEVWPHRDSNSLMYITNLINANGGFGLYLKENDNLCAWILRNNYGGMALLQTAASHKRKGYARLLAKHFSKYWAEKGLDIFAFIMVHNTASLRLFESLGYIKEHGINWIKSEDKD